MNNGKVESREFVMALDIGNTNTVVGLFEMNEGYDIPYHWRTVTHRDRTSDELGIFLLGFLNSSGIPQGSIRGFLFSSVVPSFNPIVERMARDYFQATPLKVVHTMDLPIRILYPRPFELGADRIVNAVAGAELYGKNLIVVDMGTATTFCLVRNGEYVGGTIAPGLKLSIEALARNTAQLPPIEFTAPEGGVIGLTTIQALQAGFFYGWVGLLKGIIEEIKSSYPQESYFTVATGGLASLIKDKTGDLFNVVDPFLTLKGLKILYKRNAQ